MDRGAFQIERIACLKDPSRRSMACLRVRKIRMTRNQALRVGKDHIIWDLIGHNDVHLYPQGCRKLLKSFKQDIQYFIESKTLTYMTHLISEVLNMKNCISKN